jgi:hypothetical protein
MNYFLIVTNYEYRDDKKLSGYIGQAWPSQSVYRMEIMHTNVPVNCLSFQDPQD